MWREIYFFVLIISAVFMKDLFEGDKCILKGKMGVCKIIHHCPLAIQDIVKQITPKICSYKSKDPIVCCEVAEPKVSETTTTSTTTEYVPEEIEYEFRDGTGGKKCPPIDPKMTAPRTGQKAWDKCIEYQEEFIYPCKRSMSLIGNYKRSYNCKQSAKKYIVNGEDAKSGEFPHMALLGYVPDGDEDITFSCGGSVISDKFIMTAGHCIHGGRLGPLVYALVGSLKRSDKYTADNLYRFKRIIKHPKYASPKKYNDIALLETDRSIKLSVNVMPACLDVGKEPANTAVATGWGATAYAGSNADTLQKVNLTKYYESECATWHQPSRHMAAGFDGRTQICYGDKEEAKDTCGGDSGGPLQIQSSILHCMYVVVGVTSFGRMCGNVGQPGVYTRVAEYVPWIESVVWP